LRGAREGETSTLIKLTNISCVEGQLLRNDFLPVLDEIVQQTAAQAAVAKRAQAAAAAAASAPAVGGGRQLGSGAPSAAAGVPQRAGGLRSRFNMQSTTPAESGAGAAQAAASFATSTPPRLVSGVAASQDDGSAAPEKRARSLLSGEANADDAISESQGLAPSEAPAAGGEGGQSAAATPGAHVAETAASAAEQSTQDETGAPE
jgi:hypothetical protein